MPRTDVAAVECSQVSTVLEGARPRRTRRRWRFSSLEQNIKWRKIEDAKADVKEQFANKLKADNLERANKSEWRRMFADFLEFSQQHGEDGPMEIKEETTKYEHY